jgi:hypothetical protein
MKTAERENRNRWADMFSVCADGMVGQNRACSSTWGWKQEKVQRSERCFLLTSPSIERFYDSGYHYRFVRNFNAHQEERLDGYVSPGPRGAVPLFSRWFSIYEHCKNCQE